MNPISLYTNATLYMPFSLILSYERRLFLHLV
nr:MAG TPA: hypothetical protein [Caudoviricetes sp.]